jgi:O-antigen/teichoic acid export membrane protein
LSQVDDPLEPTDIVVPEAEVIEPPKRKWAGLSHIQINKKEAASGFRWTFFYTVINKLILPLLNNAVILRILGPEIGTVSSLAYSFFAASDTLRDFGLNQTYMRDHEMTPRKEAAFMLLGILQGVLPAAVLFAIRNTLAEYYRMPDLAPLMLWISLGLAINGFWTIPKAKVLKAGRIRESGAREMIANVVSTSLSIWMLFHGYRSAMCLIFPLFVNCVLNVVITYGLAPVLDFRSDIKTMYKIGRSAISTMGASALYNIYIQADNMTIGRLVGGTSVGLYDQGQGLAMKPMQLLSVPMMAPLQAAFSQNSRNHEKIGSIYGRALAAALLFIVPCYGIMIIAAEPATIAILGHKWRGSIPLVQVCCVFFGARTIGTIGGTALVAGGRARFAMVSWVFAYATAFIGCIVAAQYQGTIEQRTLAFAWAFTAGALVVYTIHTLFAFKWFPPTPEAKQKLKASCLISVLSCLFFAVCYFVPQAIKGLPYAAWVSLAIACVLGPIVHLGIVGSVLDRKPMRYMSVKGVKDLYHML